MYSLFSSSGSKISTFFIDQAVKSGEFLEYDSHLGEFVSSQFNERLFQLRERIGRFRRNAGIVSEQAPALMSKYWASAQTDRLVSIPNQDLVILLGLADIEADIVNLSIALLRSLDGDDTWLAFLTLNPSTPIEAEAERIAKETPCAADIEEWVRAQASETRVAGSASD